MVVNFDFSDWRTWIRPEYQEVQYQEVHELQDTYMKPGT
jgi:hypothetical protein